MLNKNVSNDVFVQHLSFFSRFTVLSQAPFNVSGSPKSKWWTVL